MCNLENPDRKKNVRPKENFDCVCCCLIKRCFRFSTSINICIYFYSTGKKKNINLFYYEFTGILLNDFTWLWFSYNDVNGK